MAELDKPLYTKKINKKTVHVHVFAISNAGNIIVNKDIEHSAFCYVVQVSPTQNLLQFFLIIRQETGQQNY